MSARNIEFLDQIIKIIPGLSDKREYIVDKLTAPPEIPEYVVQQITINDRLYYRDQYGAVVDENANLVGVWQANIQQVISIGSIGSITQTDTREEKIKYYLFDDSVPELQQEAISL